MQTYNLSGLHCKACVKLITGQLKKIPDILKSEVDLQKEVLIIEAKRDVSPEEINELISNFGYSVI